MVTIKEVAAGSYAEARGIKAGDKLVSVNRNDVFDVLDYTFYMSDVRVALHCKRGSETYEAVIEKGEYEDIGLLFDTYLMDGKRRCGNNCVFCFVDQNPSGMRESVYFKDDDERLSFLQGSYITLTNLSRREIERIKQMKISPVNVSVHTTDPEVRIKMMKNKHAGEVMPLLRELCEAGITVNAQIVLCRDFNDGEVLERTLNDLASLFPQLASVAIVPCGLTRHRDRLPELTPFDTESYRAALNTVREFSARQFKATGHRLFFASDEFFLGAGEPLPQASAYEGYLQLENGVGLLTSLCCEFRSSLAHRKSRTINRTVSIATGRAASQTLQTLCREAEKKFPGLHINVYPIRNDFFGESITVAGLVTGGDIVSQLTGKPLGDELLFPRVMLRADGDLFLDNYTPARLSEALGIRVRAVGENGAQLLGALVGTPAKRA